MTYSLPKQAPLATTPEDALYLHPESESINLDALDAITSRTTVLLDMLTAFLITPENSRPLVFSDEQLTAYLWQVSGNVDLIQKWIDHAHRVNAANASQGDDTTGGEGNS